MFGRDLSSSKVCVNIKRIKVATIPLGDQEITDWVYERFYRKDKLLSKMHSEANAKLTKYCEEKRLLHDAEFFKKQAKPQPWTFYRIPGETLQNEPFRFEWWGNAWNQTLVDKKD